MSAHLLLGPQRPKRTLGEALATSSIPEGSMALITAGWQEAENDFDEVRELLGRPLENLQLWTRAEEVFREVPRLRQLYRERQDQLMELQRLYRTRLKALSTSARRILRAQGNPELVGPEQRHAIAQIRALDRHHLRRAETIQETFERTIREAGGEALNRHVEEIAATLKRHRSLVIGGGNVLILQNRMRLFAVHRMMRQHALVAWSAGAMVLADRVVLFHDNTPEGRRDAELVGAGFGTMPGFVFFPDTDRRLRTGDVSRVGLLSRRFAPDLCVALNCGTVFEHDGQRVIRSSELHRLRNDGVFEELHAA
ncbi:MAG: hypothetical protein AAF658_09235 [Myxococcota bacterium]